MKRKDTLSVYVEPEQSKALRELSRRTRVPMAVYVREAIARLLESHERAGVAGECPQDGAQ